MEIIETKTLTLIKIVCLKLSFLLNLKVKWGLGIGDWAKSPIPNPHYQLTNFDNWLKNNFLFKN